MICIHTRTHTEELLRPFSESVCSLSGGSACPQILECTFSSLCPCRPCGESRDLISFILLGFDLTRRSRVFAGQPFSRFTKRVKWLVVTTTSPAACFSPGSATTRAGSPPTRYASTSGTPCRTCSRTARIRPCSSLMCRYPSTALLCSSCLAGSSEGRFVVGGASAGRQKGS